MAFSPRAHDTLYIDGIVYSIAEHPAAPGLPYGQEGRAAVVYRLVAEETGDARAFKVFKPRFQIPALVGLSERLEAFASLPGLQVCRRQVITSRRNIELVRQHPGLNYSVLMPWIEGPTWMEVLLEGQPLTAQQSRTLARTLAEIFAGMEERGVAHCDLSGPNLLLPVLAEDSAESRKQKAESSSEQEQSAIELVDVEQMFGEDLKRPEFVPAGSSGYAHRSAAEGQWNARADRFAGALLISEMLGWCNEGVRKASWGESYFDPEEMQQDTDRYRLLLATLRDTWGDGVARLLEQSWESDSFADCATFGQWVAVIPDRVPAALSPSHTVRPAEPEKVQPIQALITTAPAPMPISTGSKGRDAGVLPLYIREMLDEARRFEEKGNLESAIATYREVLSMAPAGSGLATEIPIIIGQLEAKQPQVIAIDNVPPVQTSTPAVAPPPVPVMPEPVYQPQPQPQQPQMQRVAPVQQSAVPQPAREEIFIPAQQARAQQATATSSRSGNSIPILPVALVLVLLVFGVVAFFLLQPKSQAGGPGATPTTISNATPVVTAIADNPTLAPTTEANNPTAAPTVPITGSPLNLLDVATLVDNTDKVSGVAFSPDSQSLASSSEDGTVKVWQSGDGKLVHIYSSHAGPLYSLTISPDGKQIAAGLATGSVVVWDANTGALLETIGNSEYSVTALAFSPDGKTGAIARVNGEITLVRTDGGAGLLTLKGAPAFVHSLAFSNDGTTLYSAALENKVQAWKVADGTPLDSPFGSVTDSMALSPDGQTLALGRTDAIELWNVSTGQRTQTITGMKGDVKRVAFTPNGQVLAAAVDRIVMFYRVSDGTQLATLQEHALKVNAIAFSPDGQFFASGSDDKTVRVWKLDPTQAQIPSPGGQGQVTETTVAELPTPAPATEQPTTQVQATPAPPTGNSPLNVTSWLTITGHTDIVNGIAFAPDGQTFASASSDKSVKLWQANDGKEIRTFSNPARAYSLAFSPKSDTLAAGFEDGSIRLWTVYDGVELALLDNEGSSVFSLAFSPDKTLLAAGLVTGEIKLWRLSDNTVVRTLKGPPGFVYRLIFSPDGKSLYSGSHQGEIKLWTVADGSLIDTSPGADADSIALLGDGQAFAIGRVSGNVELWDAASKKLVRTFNVFSGDVWSLAFSPDGKTIASGSGDGTIKLSRVDDGAELVIYAGHTGTINGLAFSPDGKTVVSVSDDKTIRLWKVPATPGQ